MLADDAMAEVFAGGTVYQAFLDARNYHRWHSPVSGTIRKAFVQQGTYFSEAESEGEDPKVRTDLRGNLRCRNSSDHFHRECRSRSDSCA